MRIVFSLAVLLSTAALADERYLGSLNSTAGASTNNFAVGSTKADGTAGAFTLGGTKVQYLVLQCDVPVRYRTGVGGSVAAANSGANKGMYLGAGQARALKLGGPVTAIAVIPASGTGNATCDVWLNTLP
jgi:hypothetical protein